MSESPRWPKGDVLQGLFKSCLTVVKTGITGRAVSLATNLGAQEIYPEIVQIIYLPQTQQTRLITRDLRYAEVVL